MKRYYAWIAVCFVLLLCVVIYIIGRNIESDTRANEFDETEETVDNIGSVKQNEDLTASDPSSSTDNAKNDTEQIQDKKDPYQGEWDPQSN